IMTWTEIQVSSSNERHVDRLGCKPEEQHPIMIYLTYLADTVDERRCKMVTVRERWSRLVMDQEKMAELIRPGSAGMPPPPEAVSWQLGYPIGLPAYTS